MTHRFKIEASFAKSFSSPLELRVYAGTNRDDSIIFRGKAASDLYEILTGDLSIAKKKEDMMDDKTINKKYLGEVTDITEANFIFDPQTMKHGTIKIAEDFVNDVFRRPDYYCEGRQYEPKDVIMDWNLNWNLGNVIKYVSRAGRKGDALTDLKKAEAYLSFEIDRLEKKGETR